MLARVRQFREAGDTPDERDIELAKDHLAGALLELFMGQDPRDVRHGARTANWLIERGDTDAQLIQAALLHDVAKGRQRRWDRVGYVVAAWLRVDRALASRTSRFELRRAVDRSLRHAGAGATLLQQAGAADRVVELTKLHHVERTQDAMLNRLIEADAAS
jgi:hypothetical protein